MSADESLQEEERLDLSGCDPQRDTARFEQLLEGIRRAAAAELHRRQAALGLWGQFWRWRLPILAGSGLLALAALAFLLTQEPAETPRSLVAEATGVPSAWLYRSASEAEPAPRPAEREQR